MLRGHQILACLSIQETCLRTRRALLVYNLLSLNDALVCQHLLPLESCFVEILVKVTTGGHIDRWHLLFPLHYTLLFFLLLKGFKVKEAGSRLLWPFS